MPNYQLRLLSYVVMAYMLLAFTWWTLLLYTKNRDAFEAKRDLMKIGMAAEGRVTNYAEFESSLPYQDLSQKYKRQEWMIFGEATMFIITLLTGIWFINSAYSKQVNANQQRRNFLLSITHELKSPIASVRLVLETLLKRELPKEKKDMLAGSALAETERLHELVENLLLSAKLETAYQPHFEEVNLVSLLEDLLAKLAGKHPEAHIALDAADNFPLLRLDRQGIASIANNLLENAIKYTGGQPAHIEVKLALANGHLVMDVADRGTGIPDPEKKRIFDKFYRIGSEETRTTKGTGLGLFIVEQITKAHHGRIEVLDNVPQGTVFRIEIPQVRTT